MSVTKLPTCRRRTRWLNVLGAVALLAAIPSAVLASARPMRFRHLSSDDGLSQGTVLCMLQDQRGFIWLGTEDGLNRFDGYQVITYRHNPADPNSLPGDVVWALVEDPSGDLWVGTEGGGVARWDHLTGRFIRYRHDPANVNSLSSDAVRVLHLENGQVWIGTRGAGLNRLNPRTGQVVRYLHDAAKPNSLAHNDVYVITRDRSGRLWIGTDGGLSWYDRSTDSFVHAQHDPSNPASLSDNRVRAVTEDRDGRLWVGTSGGLNLVNRSTERVVRFIHDEQRAGTLSHNQVRAILEDTQGRLWIATDGGLNLLLANQTFDVYRHDPAVPDSLASDRLMSLYEDRAGILWIGTRTAGADRWNPAMWSFGHFASRPGEPAGLSENNVTAFAEAKRGVLFVGTLGGGLNRLDRTTGEVRQYRASAGPAGERLSDDTIMALLTSRTGTLWIGTYGGGLNRLDPVSGRVTAYRHDPRSPATISANGVMSLFEDRRGRVWVGTYGGGLNRLDPEKGTFTRIPFGSDDHSISSPRVTCITEDRQGRLWVGTDGGGLNQFDPESGLVRAFRHDLNDPSSLSSNAIFSLSVDRYNVLWVGTRGGGLNKLKLASQSPKARFQRYSTNEGLPNNVIYGILPDEEGRLWLSTNCGITRFDARTAAVESYNTSHGLQAAEFNFGAHFRSPSGELFFGGVNGFNAFYPARLAKNIHQPPVVLTALLKAGTPVPLGQGRFLPKAIDLGWRDDVVTFEFSALDFAAPERNRYEYRLEGFDKNWIALDRQRRVTYTDPGPGHYVLRVRAANNDGVWSDQQMLMAVNVEAPPWRRWWAYGLYVLAFGGIVFGTFWSQRARIAREARYSATLEQEVYARTQELAERNTELAEANTRLQNASVTDPLTGLRNRRFLFEHVAEDIALVLRRARGAARGERPAPNEMVFMMIDLDHFKPINDACGHQVGDSVLRQVVDLLTSVCRPSDVLIRWGGDEFLLLARDTGWQQAANLAERIRAAVAEHAFDIGDGKTVHATCSIGFAAFPFVTAQPDAVAWEDVLSIADQALYAAKRKRDSWVGLIATQGTPNSVAFRLLGRDPFELDADGSVKVVASWPRRHLALAS